MPTQGDLRRFSFKPDGHILVSRKNVREPLIVDQLAKRNRGKDRWTQSHMSHVMRKPVFAIYANNKDAEKPAHPRSLISTFVVR